MCYSSCVCSACVCSVQIVLVTVIDSHSFPPQDGEGVSLECGSCCVCQLCRGEELWAVTWTIWAVL